MSRPRGGSVTIRRWSGIRPGHDASRNPPGRVPASHPAAVDVRPRHSVRVYVSATTSRQPPATSARAQASSVAPVVWTSSTSSARRGGGARRSIASRPARRRWRAARADLALRAVAPAQAAQDRQAEPWRERGRQGAGGIEPPPARPHGLRRDRHERGGLRPCAGLRQVGGHVRRHQRRHGQGAPELERGDQLARHAVVRQRRPGAGERGARRRTAAAVGGEAAARARRAPASTAARACTRRRATAPPVAGRRDRPRTRAGRRRRAARRGRGMARRRACRATCDGTTRDRCESVSGCDEFASAARRATIHDMSLLRDYSNQARTYDETRAASPSVLGPLREALEGAPGRRLVDVGGGTGNYSLRAARRGLGAARGRPPARDARSGGGQGPARRSQADAQRLPLPDACADAVMLVSMLHHVEDQAAAIAEAKRILRPRGRLALMVFTREDLERPVDDRLLPEHARLDGGVASDARRAARAAARRPPDRDRLSRPRGRLAGRARRPPREARRPQLAPPDELLRAPPARPPGGARSRPGPPARQT